MEFQPRLIRLRDAHRYVGTDPNRFNAEVRPYVTEVRIGIRGIAFDRLDLDKWVDEYKKWNGRPGKAMKGGKLWGRKSPQVLSREGVFGTSEKRSGVAEFEEALAQATSRKRKESSRTP